MKIKLEIVKKGGVKEEVCFKEQGLNKQIRTQTES
jgi:hypothetical protein